MTPRDRRAALALFLFAAATYALVAGGHFYASDDVQKFDALDAIIQRGQLSVDEGWIKGRGGHRFSWFPLGASLLMIPGYLAGMLAALVAPELGVRALARFAISFQNVVISAGLVALMFVAGRMLGFKRLGAGLAALALGFGTMVFPYAKTSWSEPGAVFLVLAGLLALGLPAERARDGTPVADELPWMLAAGALLGAAVTVRQELAIVAVTAFGWLLVTGRGRGARVLARRAAAFALPLLAAGVASFWYEYVRYEAFLDLPNYRLPQSQIPASERLGFAIANAYRYAISPGQGIVWYSPAILAGLLGMRAFAARRPAIAGLFFAALAPLAAFYVVGWGPSSWAWAQRYTYVFVPFLVLPAAALGAGRPRRWALAAIGAGLLVQLAAVPHDPTHLYLRELARTPGAKIFAILDEPARAPLRLAVRELPTAISGARDAWASPPGPGPIEEASRQARRDGVADFWWVLLATAPLPRWPLAVGAGALAALAVAAGLAAARAIGGPERPLPGPGAGARLVYVSRKHPPAVGGMERLSAALARALGDRVPTDVVAWGGRQLALPLWAPLALARAWAAVILGHATHVHLGDAALAPLGVALRALTGARVTATACGLDVVWPFRPYQALVAPALARLDHVVAISEATRAACLARGVAAARCEVIPPIVTPLPATAPDRAAVARLVGREVGDRRLVLLAGRNVPRKGARWFVEQVVPRLPPDVLVVAAGPGHAETAALAPGRVVAAEGVTDAELAVLYATCDAFVVPNVPTAGDMEGFGLVAAEAAAAGAPVVAADLEGLRDAVPDGLGGRGVPAGDAAAFAAAVVAALEAPRPDAAEARAAVLARFGPEAVGARYQAALFGTDAGG